MALTSEEVKEKNSKGSAHDSSKTSHQTYDTPVVYDCETWDRGEQGESNLRVNFEERKAKDEEMSLLVGDKEKGSPERNMGTAEEGGHHGCMSLKEKKATPKRKRRRRPIRKEEFKHATVINSEDNRWKITKTRPPKINWPFLLLLVASILPLTKCKPFGDVGNVQSNITCIACEEVGCLEKIIVIWCNDKEMWKNDQKMSSCNDGIRVNVPCHKDDVVYFPIDKTDHSEYDTTSRIDMEGMEGMEGKPSKLNSSETDCPHPGNAAAATKASSGGASSGGASSGGASSGGASSGGALIFCACALWSILLYGLPCVF